MCGVGKYRMLGSLGYKITEHETGKSESKTWEWKKRAESYTKLLNMELASQNQKLKIGREEWNKRRNEREWKLQSLISARDEQLRRRDERKGCAAVLETGSVSDKGAEGKGHNWNENSRDIENTCDNEQVGDNKAGINNTVSEEQDIYCIHGMLQVGDHRYDADDQTEEDMTIDDNDNDDGDGDGVDVVCSDVTEERGEHFVTIAWGQINMIKEWNFLVLWSLLLYCVKRLRSILS
jgi:hypothetical protein